MSEKKKGGKNESGYAEDRMSPSQLRLQIIGILGRFKPGEESLRDQEIKRAMDPYLQKDGYPDAVGDLIRPKKRRL